MTRKCQYRLEIFSVFSFTCLCPFWGGRSAPYFRKGHFNFKGSLCKHIYTHTHLKREIPSRGWNPTEKDGKRSQDRRGKAFMESVWEILVNSFFTGGFPGAFNMLMCTVVSRRDCSMQFPGLCWCFSSSMEHFIRLWFHKTYLGKYCHQKFLGLKPTHQCKCFCCYHNICHSREKKPSIGLDVGTVRYSGQ